MNANWVVIIPTGSIKKYQQNDSHTSNILTSHNVDFPLTKIDKLTFISNAFGFFYFIKFI